MLALVVSALFVPYVRNFEHRDDAARELPGCLPGWGLLESLEFYLYDARFLQRGLVLPKSRANIAIVAIDQNSLGTLGRWPFTREWHAQIIRRLKRAGAKVIAVDMNFSASQNPRSDGALAAAMATAGNVILPSFYDTSAYAASQMRAVQSSTPLDAFDKHTPDLAWAIVPYDYDGRVRRYPLEVTHVDDNHYGSFAALVAAVYQGLVRGKTLGHYQQALHTARWPTTEGISCQVPVLPTPPPATSGGLTTVPTVSTMLIHFWGPAGTFPTYSYVDVKDHYNDAQLRQRFAGRIVFVGATAVILKDTFRVPATTSQVDQAPYLPGVEIVATATAMLLDGVYLTAASTTTNLWLLCGVTLAASLWTLLLVPRAANTAHAVQKRWKRWKAPGDIVAATWIMLSLLVLVFPWLLFWTLSTWLFIHQHLWVWVTYPSLSAMLGSMLVLLWRCGPYTVPVKVAS